MVLLTALVMVHMMVQMSLDNSWVSCLMVAMSLDMSWDGTEFGHETVQSSDMSWDGSELGLELGRL